jgi:plasmid stabilization system protein ParE
MAERVVSWTRTAYGDLEALIEYMAVDSPAAASRALDRIERKAMTLAAHATRGRIVPELREIGVLHYRELVERPWRLVYRVEADRVLVLAVLDSRRDLQTLLLERLVRS